MMPCDTTAAASSHAAEGPSDVAAPVSTTTAPTTTTSLSRSYEHLYYPLFIAYSGIFCAIRTAAYHPMTIALARKQGLAEYGGSSTFAVLRQLWRQEGGPRSLTTGLGAMAAAASLSECIYTGAYECLRWELPLKSEVLRDAAAGYTADFSCRFVYTPLLLVANRQMTQSAPLRPFGAAGSASSTRVVVPTAENTFWRTVRRVHGTEGIRGFFRGLGATITVGCSWSGVWWAMYVQSKRFLYSAAPHVLPTEDSRVGRVLPSMLLDLNDNVVINGMASMVTSAATAVLFNPFLVVRTRLQIEPPGGPTKVTFRSVARQVMREAGVRGFFKGTCLSISACVVDGLMAATTYEWAKYLADRTHHHRND